MSWPHACEERGEKPNGVTIVKLTKPLKSEWAETRGIDFILL